jgi:hypothetical protein
MPKNEGRNVKMKKFLTNLIERKNAEINELKKRSDASEDIAEVRAIGETLEKLSAEIKDAEAKLAEVEAAGDDNGEERAAVPANAVLRNAHVVASFGATENGEENKETITFTPGPGVTAIVHGENGEADREVSGDTADSHHDDFDDDLDDDLEAYSENDSDEEMLIALWRTYKEINPEGTLDDFYKNVSATNSEVE